MALATRISIAVAPDEGESAVFYNVEAILEKPTCDELYRTRHRYKEFDELRKVLADAGFQTPNVSFPPKIPFCGSCRPLTGEALEQRRNGLERYVTAMSNTRAWGSTSAEAFFYPPKYLVSKVEKQLPLLQQPAAVPEDSGPLAARLRDLLTPSKSTKAVGGGSGRRESLKGVAERFIAEKRAAIAAAVAVEPTAAESDASEASQNRRGSVMDRLADMIIPTQPSFRASPATQPVAPPATTTIAVAGKEEPVVPMVVATAQPL